MKLLYKTTVFVVSSLLAISVLAQGPQSPEERAAGAVKVRQAVFTLLGNNMGAAGAMARGHMPYNAALAEKSARRIVQLSKMITDSFRMDTRDYDLETAARGVIWEKPDVYAQKAADLTRYANAALAAVQSGDEGAARKALGGIGRGCGSCHDDFRVEDE